SLAALHIERPARDGVHEGEGDQRDEEERDHRLHEALDEITRHGSLAATISAGAEAGQAGRPGRGTRRSLAPAPMAALRPPVRVTPDRRCRRGRRRGRRGCRAPWSWARAPAPTASPGSGG